MKTYIFNYRQYRKKLNKVSISSFIFLIIVVILSLVLYTNFLPKKEKFFNYHLVEIASFQTYSEASNFSIKIKNLNGAGYIFYDQKYRVIACGFSDLKDAKSVVKNLNSNFKNSCVFTVKISKKNFKNLDQKTKQNFEKFLNNSNTFIHSIFNLNLKLDKKEIELNKLLTQLKICVENYSYVLDDFIEKYKHYSFINPYKSSLKKIKENTNYLNNLSNKNFSSVLLKNTILDFIFNLYSFSIV